MKITNPTPLFIRILIIIVTALTYIMVISNVISITNTDLYIFTTLLLLFALNQVREFINNKKLMLAFVGLLIFTLIYFLKNGVDPLIDSDLSSTLNKTLFIVYLALSNAVVWTYLISLFVKEGKDKLQ
jgi:O-antigen ligase